MSKPPRQRFNADPQHAPSKQQPPKRGDLRTLASGSVQEWNGREWIECLPSTKALADWLEWSQR